MQRRLFWFDVEYSPLPGDRGWRCQPLEKSRAPEKALDKLVEFASEFTHIQKLVIFQSAGEELIEEAVTLRNRLEQTLEQHDFPTITYDPIVASHIGPDGLGMVIYEGTWR